MKITNKREKNVTINNDIQEFENQELGFRVRCIKNEDGSISMNAEDTVIGFGLIQKQIKNGKEYTSIRWETFNNYCKEFGFPNLLGKDDFIPETLFYLLGMKTSNEIARKFQMWLATEVIPSIRKHGAFIADSENIDEDFIRNELRFSQKRTIKTFANAKPEEFKGLYEEFRNYIDTEYKYQTSKRVARYKSVEKGLKQWLENNASDPDSIGDCYNVKKLEKQVILDRTTLEKRISGGEKAAKTKRICELEDAIAGLSAV